MIWLGLICQHQHPTQPLRLWPAYDRAVIPDFDSNPIVDSKSDAKFKPPTPLLDFESESRSQISTGRQNFPAG